MKSKRKAGPGGCSKSFGAGGGPDKVYLHAIPDAKADLLVPAGNTSLIQDIERKSGADVWLDKGPSLVEGMKVCVVRGESFQRQKAVELISQQTGVQAPISAQAQQHWLRWTEAAFPDLDSKAYFLPPVYVNRVPMTRESIAGQDVFVLGSTAGQSAQASQQSAIPAAADQPPRVQDSDIRDDAAMQRVITCLQNLAEQQGEPLVAISQLLFQNYLGSQFYADAAEQLRRPRNFPQPPNWRKGDFDVLIIHRHHGFVVLEVKSFDDDLITTSAQHDICDSIRKKVKVAATQLDKAQAMLSHLVSDVTPGLRIIKAMAFPNLTSSLAQQSIKDDHQLTQELCRILGAKDLSEVIGLCLWSDQLSDVTTPCHVSDKVLREVQKWWQLRVAASGPDKLMNIDNYKTLVARFCGPATTVTVPCISSPRLSVKTPNQGVSLTGELYAEISLFPEQADLLYRMPPRVLLAGPPGTGKSVVLQLVASKWQQDGKDVHILSSWYRSRAACGMLHHLLQLSQASGAVPLGKIKMMKYEFSNGKDVGKAESDFIKAAKGGPLYVIADEVGFDNRQEAHHFQTFCKNLLKRVPSLHLWAASCYHGDAFTDWTLERMTRPLRSPPAVVREVQQDRRISEQGGVLAYSQRAVPDLTDGSQRAVPHLTDGPAVRWIRHRGKGHTGEQVRDCAACGQEVVNFLKSLRLGIPASSYDDPAPPGLQHRDVLVLDWGSVRQNTTVVMKMREAAVPVQVIKDENVEDVAAARSDKVWVGDASSIRGLERKVVVCLGKNRFHAMSRCTSQLVVVSD